MSNTIYEKYIRNFDINLLDCKFLGKGHNGIVYLLPEGKVIKICYDTESCKKEYNILRIINKNKYFPRVYGMNGNYMIRDYIDGIPLKDYIKKNGLSREMSVKIIKLLDEFRKLNFSKEDLRCKDIIVKPDNELMVIDPKKFYTKTRNFPRHLSKGLYRLGVLDTFMDTVKSERPRLYDNWNKNIFDYLHQRYNTEK